MKKTRSRHLLLALLGLVIGMATLGASCQHTKTAPELAPVEIKLQAWCWGYEPSYIHAFCYQKVRVSAVSLDCEHTFTCPELNLDLKIPARGADEVTMEFTVAKPGKYFFVCTAPCGPVRSRQLFRLDVDTKPLWP